MSDQKKNIKSAKSTKLKPWQLKLHEIIFEADTLAGRVFDIGLLIAIVMSIAIVMLESVPSLNKEYNTLFYRLEWSFTIIFTLEYFARIISIGKPYKYIFSFYGIIDFLSIIPTYLGLFFVGSRSLMVIRSVRLMRIFRILKLAQFIKESKVLGNALKASRHKIFVFLLFVLTVSTILGTVIYLIESPDDGFTSIPRSIYWAIITLTTVGYGDITPVTPLGQLIASVVMIMGYAIIAVPTGMVTAEFIKQDFKSQTSTQVCTECLKEDHDDDALFCNHCGTQL